MESICHLENCSKDVALKHIMSSLRYINLCDMFLSNYWYQTTINALGYKSISFRIMFILLFDIKIFDKKYLISNMLSNKRSLNS